ncbi:phosphate binding protein [Nitrosococcus halophilus Nc 4]|uniref:Phosphate binding protein n=1 Tax=Nitrosococcus halophilus (strain Nc4) TaxID=472759 RepID=D5BYQ3_NITHN|nr:phosphate ABC transporter substrate-binding protein [Nitrosococcus halophilus]ADE16041.1 phosphate binding protein [Nitrosococcus halophilus Nc 4]
MKSWNRSTFTLWLLTIFTALPGCDSPDRPLTLTLTGSSTIAPLASEIGKRFERQHPEVRIDVQTGGSSRGIADAQNGLADIGMVSRGLRPEENNLYGFTLARDGIAVITHKDNPVQQLTDQQIIAIYTGQVTNWKEVGGQDAPITVVNKAEGRSTLALFLQHFSLKSQDIAADVIIGDNEQGIKTVAGNPDAIGYVSIGTAEFDAQQSIPIKLLPLGSVPATIENVRKGSFPLSRPLNLVTGTPPEGWVKEFISFAQSAQVHDLIKEQYFVPLEK